MQYHSKKNRTHSCEEAGQYIIESFVLAPKSTYAAECAGILKSLPTIVVVKIGHCASDVQCQASSSHTASHPKPHKYLHAFDVGVL